jgi:hypothetical protein
MLRYGGYTWLLDVRDSPIQARIDPSCRAPRDVHWQVDLQYIAAGREWRRVKSWLRPTLRLCVYGFRPGVSAWQELEGQCFASDEASSNGGALFIETTNWKRPGADLNVGSHRLHFVKRHGIWFTTELTALDAERTPMRSLAAVVRGDGRESPAAVDPKPDYSPGIYVIEDLPFGLVEVAAPANARCPADYAKARARTLTGAEGAADADVGPRLMPHGREWRPLPGTDWRVRLHYGSRWTHFRL